jgi:hypothetical protein
VSENDVLRSMCCVEKMLHIVTHPLQIGRSKLFNDFMFVTVVTVVTYIKE